MCVHLRAFGSHHCWGRGHPPEGKRGPIDGMTILGDPPAGVSCGSCLFVAVLSFVFV